MPGLLKLRLLLLSAARAMTPPDGGADLPQEAIVDRETDGNDAGAAAAQNYAAASDRRGLSEKHASGVDRGAAGVSVDACK